MPLRRHLTARFRLPARPCPAPLALLAALALLACGAGADEPAESETSASGATASQTGSNSPPASTTDEASPTSGVGTSGATTASPSGGTESGETGSGSGGTGSGSGVSGSGSGSGSGETEPSSSGLVPAFGTPRRMGELPEGIVEASGLVQSYWDDDRLWTHNDSGYDPELFAIRQDGTLLSVVTLPVPNRDWEDIARGPCAPGEAERVCLYVGEIGDNVEHYPSIAIHRIREPEVLEETMTLDAEDVETMRLVYPDRPQDAEALVVDADARLWILSKRPPGVTRLYTAAFEVAEEPVELTFVREFDLSELGRSAGSDFVTAADWDPEQRLLLLRQYFTLWALPVPSGDLNDLFDLPGVFVPSRRERQGEAIAWLRGGSYMHVSEGAGAALWRIDPVSSSED